MKIENHTKWCTEDMRYIIGQALHPEGVKSTGLSVVVRSHKRLKARYVSWRAWCAGSSSFICLWLPKPLAPFDPYSEDHEEIVLELTRDLRKAAVVLRGGVWANDSNERPIQWLADWYEVHRSQKGIAAGCRPSPLMLEAVPVVDKAAVRAEKLEHARAMFAKAVTREKRAATFRKKWERSVRALERVMKK